MLTVLGGLALFLLGIERISGALTAATGTRLRRIMASATSHPLKALGVGTLVSAATQSGTATAVTTLGLVASGLVAVREGIALSLGAKVGATLAVQVAAFDVGGPRFPSSGSASCCAPGPVRASRPTCCSAPACCSLAWGSPSMR